MPVGVQFISRKPLTLIFMKQSIILWFVFLMSTVVSVKAEDITSDSLALVALYQAANGSGWRDNSNWLEGPVDTWYGVTVSDNRVVELFLGANNLCGALSDEVGNLSSLRVMDLRENHLSSTIPVTIGDLPNLKELALNTNHLEGSIPTEFSKLASLELLFLGSNQLSEGIPTEIGELKSLQFLSLEHNQLTSIPEEIGSLSNLIELGLSNNKLTGNIPAGIGKLSKLRYFDCSNNQLSGSIPESIGNLTALDWLGMANNNLSGTLPSSMEKLVNVRYVSFERNFFTGAIPNFFQRMTNLMSLNIRDNKFTHIPDLSELANLSTLIVSNNYLNFRAVEDNLGIPGFVYSPQTVFPVCGTKSLVERESFNVSLNVDGTANQYQWRKNGSNILGAKGNSIFIRSVSLKDAGTYELFVTSSVVPDLVLQTDQIVLSVSTAP